MELRIGKRQLELGGQYLKADLRDSNDLLDDPAALKQRLEDEGYLLIRGLHPREQVMEARQELLEKLAERRLLKPGTVLMDGVINPEAELSASSGPAILDYLQACEKYRALVKDRFIMGFFEKFLGGPVLTYDYKWLRRAATGTLSAIHCDSVFMNRGTKQLYSCWTPLGDIPLEMGPIVVWRGSHRLEKIKQTYGQGDVDRDLIQGSFGDDPVELADKFGGYWASSNFQAGDVVIFGIYLLHASLENSTERFRLSVDTRYQLASEPVDERWIGPEPVGHYAYQRPGAVLEPVAISRTRWGV